MTATIDQYGVLEIRAETPLESYAIQMWIEHNWKGCTKEISTENLSLNWSMIKIRNDDNGNT